MHLDHAAHCHHGLLIIRGRGQRAVIVQRRADARTPIRILAPEVQAHIVRYIPNLKSVHADIIYAGVQQLHAQIERMTCRIRELENGLGAVYSTISKEKHLLLSGEDMTSQGSSSVDVPMSTPPSLPVEADPSVDGDDVINCFGA